MNLGSMTTNSSLVGPVLAMVFLTCIVWLIMYFRRVRAMKSQGIDPNKLHSPAEQAKLAGPANWPAENYNHLFEMPVLFYVVCLLFIATGKGDAETVQLAWGFVATRVIHSAIQISYNKITHRFSVFLVSSIVMFLLLYKAWALLM